MRDDLTFEERRLATLDRYQVFDTEPESEFDDITALAAEICRVPMALVSFVGRDRQFFKAEIGLGVRGTPLDVSFCAHALLEDELLVVADATVDPRFSGNPLVTGEPYLRFYAGALLRASNGLPIGTLCVLDREPRDLDVAQRRALQVLARQVMTQLDLRVALRASEESETRLRWAQEAGGVGVFGVGRDGILQATPEFCRLFGVEPAEALPSSTFEELVIAEDRHLVSNMRSRAAGTAPRSVEYRIRRADTGELRWIARKGEMEFGADGLPIRFAGVARDITDQVRERELLADTEKRLRELNATLEHEVEERTRALMEAEEQLRQAQKMEAVGQLTGGIAHDFNNMLTGVIGGLDLVQRNIAQGRMDRVKRYLEAASTSAQRAAALTARLLAFGRRQSLDLQPTDINVLIGGMRDLLRSTLGEQIVIATDLPADLWAACTDRNQLESALLNLCINARDAMPDGGTLTIETANTRIDRRYVRDNPDAQEGDYVVLSVSDTGQGMSRETMAKVFEPFFTTKPVGAGTGLGLSMIYGFARQSGGHVRIYSELGRGTTVKLYIPRFMGEAVSDVPEASAAPRGAGETVMVVEDDEAVRLIVLEVLGELGYNAVDAADGRAALPILQSAQRIDLLVTDVGLPGINGRQLAEMARQSRPELKILFITGYAQNAAVRAGFLDPGMEMMTKPFAVDALATKMREMLER